MVVAGKDVMLGRFTTYGPIVRTAFFVREGEGDDGKGGGGGGGDDKNKPPKTFSQAEVDRIVEDRLAQERRQGKKEEGMTTQERSELERLRQESAERIRKDAEAERNYNKALDSATSEHKTREKQWGDERSTLLDELKRDRIHGRLVAAAALHGAINPDAVAKLCEDRARLDSKRNVEVLDQDGQPWFIGGKAATIDQLVKNFLDQNPWAVKPAGGEGSGAKGSKAGNGDTKAGEGGEDDLEQLETELEELEKQAQKDKGLVTKFYALKRKVEALRREKEKKKAS